MPQRTPAAVAAFLRGRRIAIAGVSRQPGQAANAIYRRLREAGYVAVPLNPNATEVEGTRCYPDLGAAPGPIDGLVIATAPAATPGLVRQCAEHGVGRVWFHRSFGQGSVNDAAVARCRELGIDCIVGGCPLMYLEPVDIAHRCMRWWLRHQDRLPG